MASEAGRGVPVSTLSPKFLHTNSTSHTWPFSAIAELIDNAYDPDVSATHIWIDKTRVRGHDCLIFMDNGNGLDHEKMLKMLSFGYSDKNAMKGQVPIGMYGNGFKSGSMRLGKDAIVFSKSKTAQCVGMLSQTYLKEINAEQIIVPIVCFEQGKEDKITIREDDKASLQDILQYSPFATQEELLREVESISCAGANTGTRIIIWNLCRTSTGTLEFDFETDHSDIKIPTDDCENKTHSIQLPGPTCVQSLRAYCSILYLKPRMNIIIRGQKVQSQLIAKSLAYVRKDNYNPVFLKKRIPITFGYNTKNKDQYGVMMYHKNRLIKAYERLGCQLKANNKGVGVIGVIECNFLEPRHDKQSFNETDMYRKTINNLAIKLEEYWQEIRHKRNEEDPNGKPVEDIIKQPDQNWTQCEDCLKWRKLPDGIDCKKLPGHWFCYLNPDPQFRSCQVEEEPVDSDGEPPTYKKTYKQQEREQKRNIARTRQKHTSSPSASSSRFGAELHNGGTASAESSPVSQTSCSPSNRGKRKDPITPPITPKRPKVNGFNSGTITSVVVPEYKSTGVSLSSPSMPQNNTDIVKTSTPKPQMPCSKLFRHEKEKQPCDTGMSQVQVMEVVSVITQTEIINIKNEKDKTEAEVSVEVTEQESSENPGMQKEVTHPLGGDDDAGPSKSNGCKNPGSPGHHVSMTEVQEKQQERDSLKEQVHTLTCQLQDMRNTLQELLQISLKKECSHQSSQIDEIEEGMDYKSLCEKVKKRVTELIQEKKALLAISEIMPSAFKGEENESDIAKQVQCLVQELDKRNKERDELHSQFDRLKDERADLVSQCDELKFRLQQRENAQEGSTASLRATDSSVQTIPEDAANSFRSLIDLRQNVSRLLVIHMPELDVNQVNFECNVIDEILEQFLPTVESSS